MIKKLCCHPCCTRIRVEGSKYCEKHKEIDEACDIEREKQRKKDNPREYNSDPKKDKYYQSYRWHKESSEFIKSHPSCEICGNSNQRLQVHHHWPKGYDYWNDYDFWDKSHWITLCASCHQRITKDLSVVGDHTLKYRFDFRNQS